MGDKAKIYDDPRSWFMRLDLGEIIDLRTRLLYLTIKADIHDPWRLYEKETGSAPLSLKPIDTEAELLKPPRPRLDFDILLTPQDPSAPAKRVYIIGNPRLHRRLEKLIWDPVKASEAVWALYKDNLDFETIKRSFFTRFPWRIQAEKNSAYTLEHNGSRLYYIITSDQKDSSLRDYKRYTCVLLRAPVQQVYNHNASRQILLRMDRCMETQFIV